MTLCEKNEATNDADADQTDYWAIWFGVTGFCLGYTYPLTEGILKTLEVFFY